MTLLELISNCINFTTQDEEDINPATLEQFRGSTNYRAFIKNALPEINRAIQELVTLNKFPLQCFELEHSNIIELTEEQNNSIYSIFKVEVEANDRLYSPVEYRKINRKIKLPTINGGETVYIKYYPRIRLLTEADKGTLEFSGESIPVSLNNFVSLVKSKSLVIGTIYEITDMSVNRFKVATSTSGYRDATSEEGYVSVDDSLDLNTLGINDTICNAVIPYLVKSRIWQEIEPEMAQLDRNIGLQNASLLVNGVEEPYQTNVARTNDWGE